MHLIKHSIYKTTYNNAKMEKEPIHEAMLFWSNKKVEMVNLQHLRDK